MGSIILVIYLTAGVLSNATGGPAMTTFSTTKDCERAAVRIKNAVGSKYDWHKCVDLRATPEE